MNYGVYWCNYSNGCNTFTEYDRLLEYKPNMVPWFSSILRRYRFYQILANLHVAGDNNVGENNKLHKIGDMMEICNNKFQKYSEPTQNLRIDDWHSDLSSYAKLKIGIKLWVLCEAHSSLPVDGRLSQQESPCLHQQFLYVVEFSAGGACT